LKFEILAIIPARGGSKGIKRKNIRLLNGKPMLSYTAEEALKSRHLNRIILSTEDKEIAEIGKNLNLEVPFLRPRELANDDSTTLDVIRFTLKELYRIEKYKPDAIMILQPTSPLRKVSHIDESIKIFEDKSPDSLVSITQVPHTMSPYSVMRLKKNGVVVPFIKNNKKESLRQNKPIFYARNGAAIYISKYNVIMKKNKILGTETIPYFMSKEESIDVDEEFDFLLCEYLLGLN
jgi:CMP-N,N'-diacetyllegionaminic acid synthase